MGGIRRTILLLGVILIAATESPTETPSKVPTNAPTNVPTLVPSSAPTPPTNVPTLVPSSAPTPPTSAPTGSPTSPTNAPSLAPTQVPTQPTSNPTSNSPTTGSPQTLSPTQTPTFAPTLCPIYCSPRENGPGYCANLHLTCLNGGYFSPNKECNPWVPTPCTYSATNGFGANWVLPAEDMCKCPSGYRGPSCGIPLPKTCTDTGKIFDGSFGLLGNSPQKRFYCSLVYDLFSSYLNLIDHRVELVVEPDGTSATFTLHTRRANSALIPGPMQCSYQYDFLNADLENCSAHWMDVSNLNAKTVNLTCQSNRARSCISYDDGRLPSNCEGFYNSTVSQIDPNGITSAIFKQTDDTQGIGSGVINLPIFGISVPLSFTCDTGVCVDELDFSNITVQSKVAPPEDDNVPIIAGTIGGGVGFLALSFLGCYFWRRYQAGLHQKFKRAEGTLSSLFGEDQGIGLAWEDVGYTIRTSVGKTSITRCLNKQEKQILTGHYGLARGGQVTAILGPSGAGKTSLLNILADRREGYTGNVFLVGKGVSGVHRRDVISYVQQYDSLMSTQTVRESLKFSAMLRIPNASAKELEIDARIGDILSRLKIADIADTIIGSHEKGGISGGERKRVDIGIELIVNPSLLILDEPTSGLDSNNVDVLLGVLHSVAKHEHCAVLLTIHQVSGRFFMGFDKVLIVGMGGAMCFFGTPSDCIAHCRLTAKGDVFGPLDNPAEVLLREAVSPSGEGDYDSRKTMADTWRVCSSRTELLKQISDAQTASNQTQEKKTHIVQFSDRPVRACPVQFYYLAQRSFRNFSRDLSLFVLMVGWTIAIAVFVGFVFYQVDDRIPGLQNRFGLMFFLCFYFCLTSLSSLGKFVGNRTVFQREMVSGYYRVLPYYISECLIDLLPLRIVPPILFAVIVNNLVGLQNTPEKIQLFIAILVLTNIVATSLCLMVSAGSSSIGQANYVAVLINIVSLIFGGLVLSNESTTALSQIKTVSFYHYAYEALMANELHGKQFYFNPKGFSLDLPLPGDVYLNNYGMNSENLTPDMWILFAFFCVFISLGFLFLLDYRGFYKRVKENCGARRPTSPQRTGDVALPTLPSSSPPVQRSDTPLEEEDPTKVLEAKIETRLDRPETLA